MGQKDPQEIKSEEIDLFYPKPETLDELIDRLIAFRDEHKGERIEMYFIQGDYGNAEISAYRMETPEEVNERIAEHREYVLRQKEERRMAYESLRTEFEGKS
jgi:hypothetical protein